MNTTKRLVRKVPAARVSRRFVQRARRHRGQALLLAVLLMVFAALLGSTFITVVALNLSQTSRGESKQDAQNSALAGLRDANTQLQVSEQGEHWRPEQVNTPPFCGDGNLPADINCDTYYTPFEKAQGWARDVPPADASDSVPNPPAGSPAGDWDKNGTFEQQKDDWAQRAYYKKTYGSRVFVKFPDPRQLSGTNASRPTYLVEVKPITRGEKKDELQIDVIGRSSNSETAFYRTTTNKGTSTSGAPVAFARYDANYDTETGKALETELVSTNTTGTDVADPYITVKDARGIKPGMTVLLQQGTGTASSFRDAIVRNVDIKTGKVSLRVLRTTGTPETPYAASYTKDSKVRVVSTLMDGLTSLDDDGDGDSASASAPTTSMELPVRGASDPATTNRKPIGAHINNGLIVKGNAVMGLSPVAPDADTPERKDYLNVQGRVITSPGAALRDASAAGATPAIMPSSSGGTDDTAGANQIGGTGLSNLQLLVRDSVQSDAGDPTQRGNSVRSLAPPSLDKSSERYLKLTKFADVENGSTFGYGPGVFIDNRDDVEKVGVVVPNTVPATTPAYRALSVSNLQRFWQRKSFVAKERRPDPDNNPVLQDLAPDDNNANSVYKDDLNVALVSPGTVLRGQADAIHYRHDLSYAPSVSGGSLEQQHIRGWISATEFLPRGVLIELNDNKIVITRDDLSDASSSIPDDSKSWKDKQGDTKATLATSPMSARTYRMVIDVTTGQRSFGAPGLEVPMIGAATRFNGLIYAEGNVRVRGKVGNHNKDITIVSMGNIYIEGSIQRTSAESDHVALLAKKNVVLNPTQIMAHAVGSQSRAVADVANTVMVASVAAAGATSVQVVKPGDPANADATRYFRVGDRIRIGSDLTWRMVTGLSPLTLSFTPQLTNPAAPPDSVRLLSDAVDASGQFFNLDSSDKTLVRNVHLSDTASNYYLSILHGGERKIAFSLRNGKNSDPYPREAKLKVADVNGNIAAADKRLFLTPDDGTNQFGGSSSGINLLNTAMYPAIGNATSVGPDAKFREDIEQKFGGNDNDKRWFVDYDSANPGAALPPWRLAKLFQAIYKAETDTHAVPLAVSAGMYWNSGLDILNFNTVKSSIGTPDTTMPATSSDLESLDTVSELFYRGSGGASALQWTTLPLGSISGNYTGALRPFQAPGGLLPAYRVGGFKIERDPFNAPQEFVPGLDIKVEAAVFAQDGSWFVIPMPVMGGFKTDAMGVVLAGEYENSLTETELVKALDVAPKDGNVSDAEYTSANRDALIRDAALAKATRFRRLNYRIQILGNIAQNISPTADLDYDDEKDPDGNAYGATKTWIESLSRPTRVISSGANFKGSNWQSIEYQAAPLPTDNNLYMPVSPDLVYQG